MTNESDAPLSVGLMDSVAAFASVHGITGATLVDIGCGDGATAEKLADRGATVIALDPDLRRDPSPYGPTDTGGGATFQTGSALNLPVSDGAVDAALFIYSMHHVPPGEMENALAETRRAVKPGGLVYVAEPMLAGTAEAVHRPFHDETLVRNAARAVLDRAAPLFASHRRFVYDVEYTYTDFESYLKDFNHFDFPDSALRSPAVVEAFEACKSGDGYILDQPVQVDVFTV